MRQSKLLYHILRMLCVNAVNAMYINEDEIYRQPDLLTMDVLTIGLSDVGFARTF